MTTLNFPPFPIDGDIFTQNDIQWQYDAVYGVWNVISSGPTGYSGSKGYTGSASTVPGYTGSKGDTGYTGSKGEIGYTGSAGYTGSQGYTGSASTVPGYTGSQGIGYTGSVAGLSLDTGTITIDVSTNSVFEVVLSNTISTINITNINSVGEISAFILNIFNTGTAYSIVWPASFRWPNNEAPTLSNTSGKVDVVYAYTYDGGANWYAFISGQNI